MNQAPDLYSRLKDRADLLARERDNQQRERVESATVARWLGAFWLGFVLWLFGDPERVRGLLELAALSDATGVCALILSVLGSTSAGMLLIYVAWPQNSGPAIPSPKLFSPDAIEFIEAVVVSLEDQFDVERQRNRRYANLLRWAIGLLTAAIVLLVWARVHAVATGASLLIVAVVIALLLAVVAIWWFQRR